jgi:division protein CdvB (Snf7/Vps24/ESCRT-III family)
MILSDSFVSRLEGKLGIHQRPFKEQLAILTYRLRVQRNKIESMGLMLQHRDKELFDKCVAANTTGDTSRASLYASECADIRKIVKVVLQSELALEQVIFKMETAEIMGDIAYLMHPVKNVVLTVGKQIHQLMPEVSFELSQINETLDGLLVDTGSVTEPTIVTEMHSPEAETILREADALAEQKIKSRFPELHPPAEHALPT